MPKTREPFIYFDEAEKLNQNFADKVFEEISGRKEPKEYLSNDTKICPKCLGKGVYPQSNGEMVFCFRCNGKGFRF